MRDFNQELDQERRRIHAAIEHWFDPEPVRRLRPEIATRIAFAAAEGNYAFQRMKNVEKSGGNIMSCKATRNFMRALKIYQHYNEEFTKWLNEK